MDIEYFIKSSGKMKADAIFLEFYIRPHFFIRQPSPVGGCKFKFIAIIPLFRSSYNRLYDLRVEFADALKNISDPFCLVSQLGLIGHMLPFAAAAQSEMAAKKLGTVFRQLGKGSGFGDIHPLSLLERHRIHDIPGYGALDLDDPPVFTAADGQSLFCGVDDVYVVE